jgi:hypothetical protein
MTMDEDKVVRVSLDSTGLPVPDQDPVRVKKDKQKIRWTAPFDLRITVEGYDDVRCSGGECKSGVFDREAVYKYTIHANGRDNDPSIDVKPDDTTGG